MQQVKIGAGAPPAPPPPPSQVATKATGAGAGAGGIAAAAAAAANRRAAACGDGEPILEKKNVSGGLGAGLNMQEVLAQRNKLRKVDTAAAEKQNPGEGGEDHVLPLLADRT